MQHPLIHRSKLTHCFLVTFILLIGTCLVLLGGLPSSAQGTPSISLFKSVTPDTVTAGNIVRYTITLVNQGNAAGRNVQVVDTLPPGFSYLPGSTVLRSNGIVLSAEDPTIDGRTITWEALQVPPARVGSFYGMHTFVQDKCKRGYIEYQLERVQELMGPGAYVKQLFYYITPDLPGPLSCWVDFVNEAYDRGLIPIIRLQGTHSGDYWIKPTPDAPGDYTTIANAFRRVVEGLPRRGDQPLYVEIWNEPNLNIEWGGQANPVEYAEFLVDVAAAIRAIGDPRIRILNGALSPGGDYPPMAFIDVMATVPGALHAFDVWAAHPYPGNHPPEYNIHDGTATYQDLTIDSYLLELERLAAHGRTDLQVLLTETGHALGQNNFGFEGYPPIGEENRADYTMRAFRDYWSQWPEVLGVCPFELVDPYGVWWVWDWLYPDGSHHWQYDSVRALDKSTLPSPSGILTIEFEVMTPLISGTYYNDVAATAENAIIAPALHTAPVILLPPPPTATPTATFTPQPPTPTLHPSITPSLTPTPVCVNVIVNGSFETDQEWEPMDLYYARYATEEAYEGARSMRLGILSGAYRGQRYSSVRQLVEIEPDAQKAMLSFWYKCISGDSEHDRIYCYLVREDGTQGQRYFLNTMSTDWTYVQFDVDSYIGHPLYIWFTTYNDGTGGTTAMYLDEVRLDVCGPGASPTPKPTYSPTISPTLPPTIAPTLPTATPTAASTPTPTSPATATPTSTPTNTPTPTTTPTATITPTPPPTIPSASPTPPFLPSPLNLPLVMREYTAPSPGPTIPAPTPTFASHKEESIPLSPAPTSVDRVSVLGRAGPQRLNGLALDPNTGRLYIAGEEGLTLLKKPIRAGVSWVEPAPPLKAVAVDPSLKRVYATSWEAGGVLAFDAENGQRIGTVSGFMRPSGIAARAGRVYVADTGKNRLVVLDGLSLRVLKSIVVDDAPYIVALDQRHARLYVGSPGAGTISAFDMDDGRLLYRRELPGLGYVQGLAADEKSGNLFVAYNFTPKYGGVALLDGRDGTFLAERRGNPQRLLIGTYGVAVDSLRRRFYATDHDGLLTFDAETGKLLDVIPGIEIAYSFDLAVDEMSGKVYVTQGANGQVIGIIPFAR